MPWVSKQKWLSVWARLEKLDSEVYKLQVESKMWAGGCNKRPVSEVVQLILTHLNLRVTEERTQTTVSLQPVPDKVVFQPAGAPGARVPSFDKQDD